MTTIQPTGASAAPHTAGRKGGMEKHMAVQPVRVAADPKRVPAQS